MTARIRIEPERHFAVSLRDGFDYITNPGSRPEYWPRLVAIKSAGRWRGARRPSPPRHAHPPSRGELDMCLVRIEPSRLVEYTTEQRGLPAARHWRHFDEIGNELT